MNFLTQCHLFQEILKIEYIKILKQGGKRQIVLDLKLF